MKRALSLSAVAALLLLACAWGREELVKVTVFTLEDGSEVQALRFTTLEFEGVTRYNITLLDGTKLKLSGSQVTSRSEVPFRLRDLPERAQLEIKMAEEARAAALSKSESGGVEPANRELVAAKRRENDALANLKRIAAGIEAAGTDTEQAKAAAQNLQKQIAMAEAELAATPSEMVSERKRLAARDAGLKMDLQNITESLKHAPERVETLRKELKEAQNKLDQAKAESARLYTQMRETTPKQGEK
ncbi:MAG: hypothetical protein ABSE73_17240 [Planctomycetota bacterium]